MPVRLFACMTGDCPVLYYRNQAGVCRRCGKPGRRVWWAIKGGK